MKNRAIGDQRRVQIRLAQQHIRPGLAVKREFPVPAGFGMHKGQGGVGRLIHHQALIPHMNRAQGVPQHVPEQIPAHLADERGLLAQFGQHGQHIAGRAARIGLEQRIALRAQSVLGKVNEQFAQRHNVEHIPPPPLNDLQFPVQGV